VLYLRLIILLVRYNVPVDNETPLVTNFMNLKIKPTQFFRGAYRDRMYVRMFIGVNDRTCMSICVCTIFLKKFFCWWRTLTAKKAKEDEEEHAIPISATFFFV
jgi:hypothetical protein